MVQELERLRKEYEALISRKNEKCNKNNGVYVRVDCRTCSFDLEI